MDGDLLVKLVVRWLHILSAALALGVPLYVRLVLLPAMGTLDADGQTRLKEALAKRWRMIVYLMITVFLLTGFYNFLIVKRWRDFSADAKFQYHLVFGLKFVVALVMFFISSALAGRSAKLAFMRANTKLWLAVLILLGLIIVALSGVLRYMPLS